MNVVTHSESEADELHDEPADPAEPGAAPESESESAAKQRSSRRRWVRRVGLAFLWILALTFLCTAALLSWRNTAAVEARTAGREAATSASDTVVAILSYTPENVERDLPAAADRLTGAFRDSYLSLIKDVVIPGSTQKQISAAARIAAAAPVSADDDHAVVLVFVDQTITVASDPPSDTASSVRVTLDKVDGRWLISEFTPV